MMHDHEIDEWIKNHSDLEDMYGSDLKVLVNMFLLLRAKVDDMERRMNDLIKYGIKGAR